MTAPYRLRDAYGDPAAALLLGAVVASAAALGVFPSYTGIYGAELMLVHVGLWTVALLWAMNAADGRLREVSG